MQPFAVFTEGTDLPRSDGGKCPEARFKSAGGKPKIQTIPAI